MLVASNDAVDEYDVDVVAAEHDGDAACSDSDSYDEYADEDDDDDDVARSRITGWVMLLRLME